MPNFIPQYFVDYTVQPDVNPAPSPWSQISTADQFQILSGELVGNVNGHGAGRLTTTLTADQYATITLESFPTFGTANINLYLRFNPSGGFSDWLVCFIRNVGGAGYITVTDSVTSDVLISLSSLPLLSPGDVITFYLQGDEVGVIMNGVSLATASGASSGGGNSAGAVIVYLSSIADTGLSTLEVGNVVTGATLSGNAGVAGASVSLSGESTDSTTADGSGDYSFSGLSDGDYTVTPSLANYAFTPPSQAETVSGSDVTGVDFVAHHTYSASGNAGIAGATVTYSGTGSGSVTADGSGNYTIPGLINGNYTVTPHKNGIFFSPVDQDVVVSGGNVTGIDFVTSLTHGWSPEDCRLVPNVGIPQTSGAVFYVGQTSSNPAIPGTDSRVDDPEDSRTEKSVNSRVDPSSV